MKAMQNTHSMGFVRVSSNVSAAAMPMAPPPKVSIPIVRRCQISILPPNAGVKRRASARPLGRLVSRLEGLVFAVDPNGRRYPVLEAHLISQFWGIGILKNE